MSVAVHSELLHRGPVFAVERCRFRDDDGTEVTREVVRHPGAVVIVPVLDDGRLVLIRNLRRAVGVALWEFPAGTLEAGESIEAGARRELEEETGYRAERLASLGAFYSSPGFTDECLHISIATGLMPVERRLDPGERIVVEERTPAEVRTLLETGVLRDAKTIAAFLWWCGESGS